MDDFKIFTKYTTEQRNLLKIVHSFSKDIGMRMELNKSAQVRMRSKLISTENSTFSIDRAVKKI